MLYLNDIMARKGQGFTNYTGTFYPTNQTIAGLKTYALPFNQILSDSSISGSIVPTGVTIGNSFIPTGVSGLVGIDYEKGRVYWSASSGVPGPISAGFSIKDFNVSLTSEPELRLLFEDKFVLRPKVGQTATGVPLNAMTYPCLLVNCLGGDSEPWSFGGQDMTSANFGIFVFADSQMLLDAANGILRDLKYTYVPLLDSVNQYPYNPLGGLKNDKFNYTGLTYNFIGSGKAAWVSDTTITYYKRQVYSDVLQLNPECYFSVVDITLATPRFSRQ